MFDLVGPWGKLRRPIVRRWGLSGRVSHRLALLPVVLSMTAAGTQLSDWTPARPGYEWSFPRDHWSHPGYKTEWWYLTGTLTATDDPARRFGYQFTFFRVGLSPETTTVTSAWAASDMIMGHAAVSDLVKKEHVFSEVLYRATPLLGSFGDPGDSLVAWSRAPAGTDGRWTLAWNGRGFDLHATDNRQGLELTLQTTAIKPLVRHGIDGYSRKGTGPTAASLYYSLTRLETEGSLRLGEDAWPVRGESWMDKEFGSNQLGVTQIGWDWFSLRLDDGRDVMLYLLRTGAGAIDYAAGSVVSPVGAVRALGARDFDVQVTRRWQSAVSDAEYPARWSVTVPGENLAVDIVPEVADQEVVSDLVPNLHYWEGLVQVRDAQGRRIGEGYVELTGYGTNARPAI